MALELLFFSPLNIFIPFATFMFSQYYIRIQSIEYLAIFALYSEMPTMTAVYELFLHFLLHKNENMVLNTNRQTSSCLDIILTGKSQLLVLKAENLDCHK